VFTFPDSCFQKEWEALYGILQTMEIPDRRSILGRLLILSNAKRPTSRERLIEEIAETVQQCMGTGSKLRKFMALVTRLDRLYEAQRKLLGKTLFHALSEIHSGDGKGEREIAGTSKMEEDATSRTSPSSTPPSTPDTSREMLDIRLE